MPFNHTAQALALHTLGTWQVLKDEIKAASSGWDTKNVTFACHLGIGATSETVTAQWPLGKTLGGNFWLTDVTPRALGGGIWAADCIGKGLAANRPPRRVGGASSLQRSVENLAAFGVLYPKAEVWESTPTLEVESISFTPPRTADVGTAEAPDNAPAVRLSVWDGIVDPTWHFPNGWVIADVRYEQLLDLPVWLVTTVYEYRYAFTP